MLDPSEGAPLLSNQEGFKSGRPTDRWQDLLFFRFASGVLQSPNQTYTRMFLRDTSLISVSLGCACPWVLVLCQNPTPEASFYGFLQIPSGEKMPQHAPNLQFRLMSLSDIQQEGHPRILVGMPPPLLFKPPLSPSNKQKQRTTNKLNHPPLTF